MKKYIVRTFTILFSLLMLFQASVYVNARSSDSAGSVIEGLINEKNEEHNSYLSKIEAAMQVLNEIEGDSNSTNTMSLQGASDTVASFDIDHAYKVYVLEPLFLTILNEKGSFEDAITDVIQWKVPFVTRKGEPGLATLLESSGDLSFVGMTIGEASNTWSVSNNDIIRAVENAQNFDIDTDSLKIAHSYLYNTTFVFLSGGESNYLIPFSTYSDEIGIENGTLYTVSEIEQYFGECFDETLLEESSSYNNGAPFRKQSVLPPQFLIHGIIIVCSAIAVFFVFLYYRKKSAKEDTENP